jgi:hypothetical protein
MTNILSLVAAGVVALVPTAMTITDPGPPSGPPQIRLCDGHGHLHKASSHRKWSQRYWRAYSIPRSARKKHQHQLGCAVGPNHRSVMKARWAKVKRSVLPRNHDLWIRIGRCEQPGSGYRGINWRHTGPTYQGGLGFWYGTWSGFKYPGMPSNAGYASWRQQMRVANRLYDAYGTSPWGCA